MKKILLLTLFLTGVLLLTFISPAPSVDGKILFAQKCASCHKAGGEASVVGPSKFASVQWARFFDKQKHTEKKDISSLLTQAEIDAIKKYLVDHAADSDQPEA